VIYWQLAWVFFQTGLFSVGGGYAMLPLIQGHMGQLGWMTAAEVADVAAISQMTPGPFAVNAATFVGMRLAGVPGACAATLGVILPSLLIVPVVARFFAAFQRKAAVQGALYGMRPAVAGLIASAAWNIGAEALARAGGGADLLGAMLAAAAFAAVTQTKVKISPIAVIGLAAAAGIIIQLTVNS
jgi:chromate transporter